MVTPKTAYKPGQSGNTNGRPKKGYSITDWFKQMLKSQPDVKDAIGKSILKKALEGDSTAQKLVWNYMDGMPMQQTDLTSLGEKLEGVVVYRPEKNKDDAEHDLETAS